MKSFITFIIAAVFLDSNLHAKSLSSSRIKRNAIKDQTKLWPNASVVYSMQESISSTEQYLIKKAMKDISTVSCIQFKERSDEESYVEIKKGEGCSAIVGYTGGYQTLTLGHGCYNLRIVYHELFHTLGFHHEQVRPDRDNYIVVHKSNIKSDKLSNYEKKSFSDVTTLGLPYDYNSVLHYSDKTFAVDSSEKTMESTISDRDITNHEELSLLDILKLNLLYSCL